MATRRRAALAAGLLAAPAAAALLGRRAAAQGGAYPNRTVRLVVPFTPAGTTDIAARMLAERLTQRLGQQVVVENRAGAGGNLGSDLVAKSDPDGYTLLMCTISSGAINYSLYGPRMPYRPEDLAAAGLQSRDGQHLGLLGARELVGLGQQHQELEAFFDARAPDF